MEWNIPKGFSHKHILLLYQPRSYELFKVLHGRKSTKRTVQRYVKIVNIFLKKVYDHNQRYPKDLITPENLKHLF